MFFENSKALVEKALRRGLMPKPIKKKIVKKTTSGTDASGTLSRLKKSAEEEAFLNNCTCCCCFVSYCNRRLFPFTAIPRKTKLRSLNMRHTKYTTGFIRNSLLQARSVIKRQRRYSKRHTT